MDATKKRNRISFWYHALASLLIVAVIFALATFVFFKAQAGIVVWQVYPAFAVFITLIFTADWFICRDEQPVE